MAAKTTKEIREALAEIGKELTPQALDEVLQAMAHAASYLGGECWLDTDEHWALYVAIDEDNPGECWVDVVNYEEEDADVDPQEMN